MSGLEQLYQQIILDHAKARHGFGVRDVPEGAASAHSHQYNPLCGDEVDLQAVVSAGPAEAPAPVVTDVAWTGEGCSISRASTSVLHELVVGLPVPEASAIVEEFRTMIRSRGQVEPDEEVLGDAAAFSGVGRHANRVKCAMLGWTAFEDAVSRAVADLYEAHPEIRSTEESA